MPIILPPPLVVVMTLLLGCLLLASFPANSLLLRLKKLLVSLDGRDGSVCTDLVLFESITFFSWIPQAW